MKNNTEATVKSLSQHSWEQTVKETELVKLGLPAETVSTLRLYYEIAYNSGQAQMFCTIKEIYDNDLDLFESFFEINDGLVN